MAASLTLAGSLSAANLFVGNGGDLRGTLSAARGGDTVTIQAGAQFTGHFSLPANPSSQTITIQSSAMSSLPGSGQRVAPSDRGNMPKLASADGVAPLILSTGANHYKIRGIEFLALPGVYAQDLIRFGNGNETSNPRLPYDLDLDRCYVHGDPVSGSKRGLSLNSGSATIENSYFENFISTWQDTQAISGWNGPGPYKIVNNFLSAGTETVNFGGAVPANAGVIPSDILVQNNYFFKPLSWRVGDPSYAGIPVWVKNHLELKLAQRVTIDSNTMENNWVGADQRGFALMFTVRSELGALPYTTINNIKVTNNVIRHSAAGICFSGRDDNGMGWGGADTIENNLFADVNSRWGGDGRLFQITGGLQGANFNHNTAFQSGFIAAFDDGSSSNINFTNNIFNVGQNLVGNGTRAGNATIAAYMGGGSFTNNLVIGGNPSIYPSSNFFPGSIAQVGFVNYAGQNYALLPTSPYKNVGTDGKDPGMRL